MKKYRTLFLIALIGFIIRVVYLNEFPPALNWDEVSHGFNAYSLLKTGKDEWGEVLPLIFRAYGDYKLPVYIYSSVIPIALLGLNPVAVRLPSVLAGVGIIVFTYLIALNIFSRHKILAAVCAFLVALEPWSFFISRAAFEANLALFLFLAGVYFFLASFKRNVLILLSAFFWGLTVWTYNSYRIFTPAMLVVMAVLFRDKFTEILKKTPKVFYLFLIVLSFFLLPMFFQLINPVGQARYKKVSIIDEGTVAQIIELRNSSPFPSYLSRILYNRPVFFIKNFIINWLSHFSSDYLFVNGGSHYQFSVPGHGLIYSLNFPLLLIGLIMLIKEAVKKDKIYLFLFFWLLLAPVASALTREAPHVLRSITLLPLPMILTAMGFAAIISSIKVKFKILIFLYVGLIVFSAVNYLTKYFGSYASNYSWSWQYGYKEVSTYVLKNYTKYEKIVISKKYGEPHEFILFYSAWDPAKYRNDPNLIRFYQSDWYWVDGFDKFYFVNDWEIPNQGYKFITESGIKISCTFPEKCLLITGPDNAPSGWIKKHTINFLNGKPAFEIYDNSFSDLGLLVK